MKYEKKSVSFILLLMLHSDVKYPSRTDNLLLIFPNNTPYSFIDVTSQINNYCRKESFRPRLSFTSAHRYSYVAPSPEVRQVLSVLLSSTHFSPSETMGPWEPWRKWDLRSSRPREEAYCHGSCSRSDLRLPGSSVWWLSVDSWAPLGAKAIASRHSSSSTARDKAPSLSNWTRPPRSPARLRCAIACVDRRSCVRISDRDGWWPCYLY